MELYSCRSLVRSNDHVDGFRDPFRRRRSQAALDPVTGDGACTPYGHSQAGFLGRKNEQRQPIPPGPRSGSGDATEIRRARQRPERAHRRSLRREASAALVAAALEDHPAGAGLHPGTEAVLTLTPAIIGLKGSLTHWGPHDLCCPLLFHACSGREKVGALSVRRAV